MNLDTIKTELQDHLNILSLRITIENGLRI